MSKKKITFEEKEQIKQNERGVDGDDADADADKTIPESVTEIPKPVNYQEGNISTRTLNKTQYNQTVCFFGWDKTPAYQCFNKETIRLKNIKSKKDEQMLKNDLQKMRAILKKYKQADKFEIMEKQVGFTKQQVSSLLIQQILDKQFITNHQRRDTWPIFIQNRKQPISSDYVFYFNMHYLPYPGEIKQMLTRFLIRFNTIYRKSVNEYIGPTYIMIIPGQGKYFAALNKSLQVLANTRLQKLQLYKNIDLKHVNYKGKINQGAFFIKPLLVKQINQ